MPPPMLALKCTVWPASAGFGFAEMELMEGAAMTVIASGLTMTSTPLPSVTVRATV